MKLIKAIISGIILDFFFFSTTFSFSGGINTKMALAVVGLVYLGLDFINKRTLSLPKQFIILTFFSLGVSLLAYLSSTINNTQEYAYITYFISMWVWLSGAFGALRLLLSINGRLDLYMIAKFIVWICVIQGLLALLQDIYLPLKNLINTLVPANWVEAQGRLYGLGNTACLDTGGIRFGIGSVFCSYIITNLSKKNQEGFVPLYILAFIVITITGNMVARTTLVGSISGLVYMLIGASSFSKNLPVAQLRIWGWFIFLVTVSFIGVSFLYNTNKVIHDNLEFGFEGFFNLVEDGYWHTASNDVLYSMYVFPDNPKTWIIGDGYFIGQSSDPNYMGNYLDGFYMGTDVGYLRFIYFFGITGLAFFCALILYSGGLCYKYYSKDRLLILILTAINFAVWFKVATDCFFIFALMLSIIYLENHIIPELSGSE